MSAAAAAVTKAALRRRLQAARETRSAAERETVASSLRAVVLALPEVISAATVAAYVGVGAEPGTLPLLDALHERGIAVLLPVLLDDGDLEWGSYSGRNALVAAQRGLLEPADRLGRGAISDAGVVLTPALAVDWAGHRLGRGGGAFDRALSRVSAGTPVYAVVHDDEIVDDVPVDPWDKPVNGVVTPQGRTRFG